jgi:hypothetical protein
MKENVLVRKYIRRTLKTISGRPEYSKIQYLCSYHGGDDC